MAAPVFGSVGTYLEGAAGTADVTVPSGVAAGDLIVIPMYINAGTTITALASGFAEAPNSPVVNTSGNPHSLHVLWKRATGADSGVYSFTLSGSDFRSSAAMRYTGVVSSGSPWDVTASANSFDDMVSLSPAVSVTTTGPDRMLVFAAANWAGGGWTPPSGFNERIDTGNFHVVTSDDAGQAVAGSSGTVQATCVNTNRSTAWLGALLPVVTVTTIGRAAATSGARALGVAKQAGIGRAAGTGSARALTSAKQSSLGRISAASSARGLTASKVVALARAAATALSRALATSKSLAVGRAVGAATARALSTVKGTTLGRAPGTSGVRALGRAKNTTIGRAAATGQARAIELAPPPAPTAGWPPLFAGPEHAPLVSLSGPVAAPLVSFSEPVSAPLVLVSGPVPAASPGSTEQPMMARRGLARRSTARPADEFVIAQFQALRERRRAAKLRGIRGAAGECEPDPG